MRGLRLAALLALSGCASSPILVGPPGHQRKVARLQAAGPKQPVLCVLATDIWHQVASQARYARIRDLRILTQERPGPEGCDVLLRRTPGGGGTVATTRTIQAYSAYTGELLWTGSSRGRFSLVSRGVFGEELLLPHLVADLQPDQPAGRALDAGKASGRRLSAEQVEELAGSLASVSEIGPYAGRAARYGQPRSAPSAAAPVQAAAVAPARTAVPSDVDQAPPGQGRRKGHAVIIGVERYRERLPAADFAAADARVMARYASAVLGYPEENVAVLTDERASRGDFDKHLSRWLANRVEKDDEVFVYFSGHGAPDPRTGEAYLVPYDGDPAYLAETAYPLKELYAVLSKLPAKAVTVTLDSCFSGAGGRSVLAKGARPLVAVRTSVAPAGITVLSASAGDQISNSYEEKGHGLFTYFLLKGLKEKGSDLRAAFDYAKPEVARMARRRYNADQTPEWRGR